MDDDEEIRRFADPQYWIEYFPQHVKRDLELMGLKVMCQNSQVKSMNEESHRRSIGVVHLSPRMRIRSTTRSYDGNFII